MMNRTRSCAEMSKAEIRAELARARAIDDSDDPPHVRAAARSLERWLERELVAPHENRRIERSSGERELANKRRGATAYGGSRADLEMLRLRLAGL